MKKSFYFVLVLLVMLLVSCATTETVETVETVEPVVEAVIEPVSEPAETFVVVDDFTVETTKGMFTLSEELKTHEYVFVNFWGGYCKPCKRELPFLQKLSKDYPSISFLSISSSTYADTMDTARAVAKTYGLSYPVGIDTIGLHKLREETPIPGFMLINKNREIVWQAKGSRGNINFYLEVFDQFLK